MIFNPQYCCCETNIRHTLKASLSDKLIEQMVQDDLLFYLSLGVMFIFLITSLYSFDCVISKVLLAVAGIVHVIVAGFATTGNISFLNYFSSHVT